LHGVPQYRFDSPHVGFGGKECNKIGRKDRGVRVSQKSPCDILIIYRIKLTDASKLQEEYLKLVEGLQEVEDARAEDAVMANPSRSYTRTESCSNMIVVLPDDLLKEAVPGNIRKAEHFVAFLKRFVEYLKVCS